MELGQRLSERQFFAFRQSSKERILERPLEERFVEHCHQTQHLEHVDHGQVGPEER
jgi:hypothetical protein